MVDGRSLVDEVTTSRSCSRGADLQAVGSRGHGGFVEALFGSTGQHAVHHATCPVVVIRDSATGPNRP